MGLHNFALTPEQSFPLSWAPARHGRRAAASATGRVETHLDLAGLQGAALPASLSSMERPAETAVVYSTMQIRAANHNRPVGTVNHTSWVVSEPRRAPLLSLARDQWADAIKQPTAAQTLHVPWFKGGGDGRWLELVLNNFDDKGHPFHLVCMHVSGAPGSHAG